MDWLIKHKLVTIIIVICIAGAAWYLLSGSSSSTPVLSTENDLVPPDAEKLVASLNALHAVTLTSPIFTNSAFAALQDFSTPIVPEPVGRTNPFAPLSTSEMGATSPPAFAQ